MSSPDKKFIGKSISDVFSVLPSLSYAAHGDNMFFRGIDYDFTVTADTAFFYDFTEKEEEKEQNVVCFASPEGFKFWKKELASSKDHMVRVKRSFKDTKNNEVRYEIDAALNDLSFYLEKSRKPKLRLSHKTMRKAMYNLVAFFCSRGLPTFYEINPQDIVVVDKEGTIEFKPFCRPPKMVSVTDQLDKLIDQVMVAYEFRHKEKTTFYDNMIALQDALPGPKDKWNIDYFSNLCGRYVGPRKAPVPMSDDDSDEFDLTPVLRRKVKVKVKVVLEPPQKKRRYFDGARKAPARFLPARFVPAISGEEEKVCFNNHYVNTASGNLLEEDFNGVSDDSLENMLESIPGEEEKVCFNNHYVNTASGNSLEEDFNGVSDDGLENLLTAAELVSWDPITF